MTENVENLILEHLKRFQASLDRMERRMDEMTARLTSLEGSGVSIMQHLTHQAGTSAAQQVAIDTINRRLDRIERRLELNG
jgi:tetrahydromethanopterin S-methyltransferase subunit G